ncbi:hypothetical protein B296_00014211 [Ensete ventricosum]|uniref:Protein kinase domain-containing protein n=1 Tax=Ensete ventricosum TaxID=4639 RepID=A0A427B7V7_ENSVE|nr:hypothetical protein B296_00014211 [Ensete ventricosum]
MPTAEEQYISSKLESGNATCITIIRTDYFLDSYDLNNHLWSVMISRISAHNVGPGLPSSRNEEKEIPSISGRKFPVYFTSEAGQLPKLKAMLPPSCYESHIGMWFGQVVFEGVYDTRPVAVKRLLRAHHDVACKEIQNLIASDQHPNIVRWYGVCNTVSYRSVCSVQFGTLMYHVFGSSGTTIMG